jgi:hypothetical protein
MLIVHDVITRFATAPQGKVPSAEWVEGRFKLFEDYCLPSIQQQTCPDFRWVLLVHSEWSSLEDRLRKYDPRILVVLEEDEERVPLPDCWRVLSVKPTHAILLSTRLDSDDMLAKTFCERVRQAASDPHYSPTLPYLLNPSFGYQLDLRHASVLAYQNKRPKEHTPFLTLAQELEAGANTLNVYRYGHDLMHQHYREYQIDSERLWLQLVHGQNVCNNHIDGTAKRVSLSGVRELFLLPENLIERT